MGKQLILIVLVTLILGAGWFFLFNSQNQQSPVNNLNNTSQTPSINNSSNSQSQSFANPKKSAHYESNTPSHGAVLGAVPINVVIDFNFDLAKPSEIKILKDNQDFGVGETLIDQNKLAMRRNMDPDSPDGIYTVDYKACWPDGSCHDGNFQFEIKRSEADKSVDMRNKTSVSIDLKNTAFISKDVRVSKGTKVTWTNSDNTVHYINTDSHPAHTYFPEQNSKVLNKGDSYSLTFNTPGIYPYHCSAHAMIMTGSIIVE